MNANRILFTIEGNAISPGEIKGKIDHFGYTDAVCRIIQDTKELDRRGQSFIRRASLILSNFRMTRSGRFKGDVNKKELLLDCWNEVGDNLIKIRRSVLESGFSRDRFLLELEQHRREELIAEIWSITKRLLPFTMGKTSYGLVGASKILFAVLPEIVLPIDNSQWLHLFKTVDLGDVIKRMVCDIQQWETATGKKLNEVDYSRRLTTLPSVYNVMAMDARPKNV